MRILLLSLNVLVVTTLPVVAADNAQTTANILVFGDSLSAGYGIKVESGWVALLAQRLKAEGYDYQVVNASVSGETSGGGKVRLPTVLNTHRPVVMILELGANDGLRGLPTAQMRANLATMIAMAQTSPAKVLLVGIQVPPNYGELYTNSFKAVYAELARTYHLPLVPFFLNDVALDGSLMQADNLHPNERGQPILLNNVWPLLQPLLKKPSAPRRNAATR